MQHPAPNIFAYNDFRKYLRDWQEARQRIEPEFTKSEFSRRLGLPRTRSFLNDVLKGKKVTASFIERFVQVMDLGRDEAQFFRVLVKFNQAESAEERELYFEQLIALNRTPKTIIDERSFRYYKDWRNSAVRALLGVVDSEGDPAKIARMVVPPITPKQAREAVDLLLELGLIAHDERGFLKPTESAITTGDALRDEIVKQYQLQCLELAKSAVIHDFGQPKDLSTNFLSISEAGFNLLRKKIAQFRSEVRALVHKDLDPPDRVYQLELLLFPVSKKDLAV